MRFWDSSGLVPLVVEEAASSACRQLLREDPGVGVWALTRTEIVSALCRRFREGGLTLEALDEALDRLGALEAAWTEIDALTLVRNRADRLLRTHSLRAADALQLAAALVLAQELPRGWVFVTSDERLAQAAAAEGFRLHTPGTLPPGS